LPAPVRYARWTMRRLASMSRNLTSRGEEALSQKILLLKPTARATQGIEDFSSASARYPRWAMRRFSFCAISGLLDESLPHGRLCESFPLSLTLPLLTFRPLELAQQNGAVDGTRIFTAAGRCRTTAICSLICKWPRHFFSAALSEISFGRKWAAAAVFHKNSKPPNRFGAYLRRLPRSLPIRCARKSLDVRGGSAEQYRRRAERGVGHAGKILLAAGDKGAVLPQQTPQRAPVTGRQRCGIFAGVVGGKSRRRNPAAGWRQRTPSAGTPPGRSVRSTAAVSSAKPSSANRRFCRRILAMVALSPVATAAANTAISGSEKPRCRRPGRGGGRTRAGYRDRSRQHARRGYCRRWRPWL